MAINNNNYNSSRLEVIDIKIPSNPTMIKNLDFNKTINGVAFANNHIYVAHHNCLDVIETMRDDTLLMVNKLVLHNYDYIHKIIAPNNDCIYILMGILRSRIMGLCVFKK
jgi:hypothetical protein